MPAVLSDQHLVFLTQLVCFVEYYHSDDDDRSGDEGKPVYSEDEAVSHHGLRRSQSVKITRSRLRKDVSPTKPHSTSLSCY